MSVTTSPFNALSTAGAGHCLMLTPYPSYPCSPFPHVHTSPDTETATENIDPHAIRAMLLSGFILQICVVIMLSLISFSGSPSCPSSAQPNANTFPLISRARVWASPTARAFADPVLKDLILRGRSATNPMSSLRSREKECPSWWTSPRPQV
jgi:hypothetical protein